MSLNRTSLERTSDREIVIMRTFRAPPDIVFDAWTRPELVKRWWAPASRGVTMIECAADVRPGGTYRYVLAAGPDAAIAFAGEYREVARSTGLVYTQRFEPVLGQPVPGEALVTITFEAQPGATKVIAHEVYPSKEVLDGVLASGMEEGLRETYEQLEHLVATLAA
ncbi:MAG: SRPBCC family protein [Myxococcota bacterium]